MEYIAPIVLTQPSALPETEVVPAAYARSVEFDNPGRTVVRLENVDAANPQYGKINTALHIEGLPVTDRIFELAASEIRYVGPFSADVYNRGDSRVEMEFTDAATLIDVIPCP